ncbi:AI-2E family transporter [Cribrihabitans sp. XS_ASV171]
MPEPEYDSSPRIGKPALWLLVVVTIILTGWALRAMGVVLVPVVLSFFLALLVYPLDRMTAERLPSRLTWIGHVLALAVVLLALLVFVSCLWLAAGELIDRFQDVDYTEFLPAMEMFEPDAPETAQWSRIEEVYRNAIQSLASSAAERIPSVAEQFVNAAGATFAGVILVIFLTLMMLVETRRWQGKLAVAASQRANRDLRHAMVVFAHRLRRYLLTRTVIGLVTGALYAAWLWFFGLDLLIVWALLAFLLNYVPTIGSMIAGALAAIYAFTQKDFGTAFLIGSGLFAIEQVMGNYVDPRVQGRQVSVSPLVILVALVLWSWIWGPAGAILAVPIVAAVVILFSHFETLRPVALMLSNEGSMEDLDKATDTAHHPAG